MNHETTVLKLVEIDASRRGWRLFRNSVGGAWHGRVTEEQVIQTKRGPMKSIELFGAYFQRYGLRPGSGDHIGWRPMVITPDMVGKTIAQFVSIESKTQAYNRLSDDQLNWAEQVAGAGGYAVIARRVGDGIEYEEVRV